MGPLFLSKRICSERLEPLVWVESFLVGAATTQECPIGDDCQSIGAHEECPSYSPGYDRGISPSTGADAARFEETVDTRLFTSPLEVISQAN
jgi:hypothetical protein